MTMNFSAPAAPQSAELEQRHYTCLAQLRSLLTHQEVASNAVRSDAALDMISCLRDEASPTQVLQAFCRLRQTCEPVCYLILFRLRRWLESEMCVTIGEGAPQPLDLSFRTMNRIVQHYRRQQWEWSQSNHTWRSMRPEFHWKHALANRAVRGETAMAV